MTGKQFLYIVIATFATIIIWVVSDILHSSSNVKIPPETQQLLEPVDPTFDTSIVNEL
ncbi:hypothetical protein M1563_02005 [Patescibacteria group bacterium]|nr:hypothetical protein [Patescibacteria group bacterium]